MYNHSSHYSQFFLHPNKINLISVKLRTLKFTVIFIPKLTFYCTTSKHPFMCNLAPAFIQNEVTWRLHTRSISCPLCVNGVYVTQDPRVQCENIWQRRCWQKSLGGEEAGGLMPCKPAWSTCSDVNSRTLSAQTLKLLPKFETHELMQNITHMKHYHKNLQIKMTRFVIWFVSVNKMALSTQTFAVKYHNFIQNVNPAHHFFFKRIF